MEIYAITDVSGAVRYVGQSWSAEKRQREHWQGRFRLDTKLAQWLRTLDERPSWRLLVIVEDTAANRTERAVITGARAAFPDLNLNVRARGGWGPEMRAKLSAARTGRVFSDETRAKISAANRGRKHSPEFVAMRRDLAKDQWADPKWRNRQLTIQASEETRAKKRLANTGRHLSDETKRRIADSRRAQWADPEYRNKTVAGQRGHVTSDEARAKLSEAAKAAWARPEVRAKREARAKAQ
jgi:hypothetical protein